jgi:hypothetical protein
MEGKALKHEEGFIPVEIQQRCGSSRHGGVVSRAADGRSSAAAPAETIDPLGTATLGLIPLDYYPDANKALAPFRLRDHVGIG